MISPGKISGDSSRLVTKPEPGIEPRVSASAPGMPSSSEQEVAAKASAALKRSEARKSPSWKTLSYHFRVKPCGGKLTK